MRFPGMLRIGAPSGTRTGRVGRLAYRPTTKPQWGFVSPRESPRGNEWRVQINGGSRGVFLLRFPKILRIGAPSGTRTARAPRSEYRGAKTPRWGFVSPRESPRGNEWKVQINGGSKAVFFVVISRDAADRCTIGDENSPRPAFCVPRGKNAPVGRF